MTPSDIEILLHYHCSKQLHPRYNAPAVKETTDSFVAAGILDIDYNLTSKGKVLVKMLCDTPFPVEKWVDPREKFYTSKVRRFFELDFNEIEKRVFAEFCNEKKL